jgi:hypothetical protein
MAALVKKICSSLHPAMAARYLTDLMTAAR